MGTNTVVLLPLVPAVLAAGPSGPSSRAVRARERMATVKDGWWGGMGERRGWGGGGGGGEPATRMGRGPCLWHATPYAMCLTDCATTD